MAGSARTRILTVRLTEAEYERLKRDASSLGTSVSELVRSLVALPRETKEGALAHPDGAARSVLVYDQTTFPKLIRQIRAWGYHYDHCLHALNTIASATRLAPGRVEELMSEAIGHLESIDAARGAMERSVKELRLREAVRLERRRG